MSSSIHNSWLPGGRMCYIFSPIITGPGPVQHNPDFPGHNITKMFYNIFTFTFKGICQIRIIDTGFVE